MRWNPYPVISVLALTLDGALPARAAESFETAPVRPDGGDYVPPPFSPVATEPSAVRCGSREYDLRGLVPMPTVSGRALLDRAEFVLNGKPLAASPLRWTRNTPAVAVASRTWSQDGARLSLLQTVEYDGFITCDLTLEPAAGTLELRELTLQLRFKSEASTLYHVSSARDTPAGSWPREKTFHNPIPGVWGGDDGAGFACYVATFRHWRGPAPFVTLSRDGSGPGTMRFCILSEPTGIRAPTTWRLGFIATPVRAPEQRHWQLYALGPGHDALAPTVGCVRFWSGLSDRYATFRTNDPKQDDARRTLMQAAQDQGKAAIAYTTYAHVEEGAVEVPQAWGTVNAKGKITAASIGGGMADRKRVFCCPGSREWLDWKLGDIDAAIQRYGVDGFYVDTSYVIMPCYNSEHGHGWTGPDGQRQPDFPVWSMREIWRRSYEKLHQARGKAEIYAHHKGGCPPALAAFTTAFCDGEQYTSQSIKTLTLDAFRAQNAGRNMGPLALFLCEYYRSASFGTREKAEHHNPTESAMLALLHDVLCTGYPGEHPNRELIALRDDLGIAEAAWTPYYAPGNPWKAGGDGNVAVSAYRNARGDTLLVAGNPEYGDIRTRITGPAEATAGRSFVAIDVLARIGKRSTTTTGYRWEEAGPDAIAIPARSFRLFAWVREPRSVPAFAGQHGFAASDASHARRTPLPPATTLLDDFEDPDWTLASDQGGIATTNREPVDTVRAMRVMPMPEHDAAGLLRGFEEPQDWSGCTALSFWVRPDRAFPLRAFSPRLRDRERYGPALTLASHEPGAILPAGQWTQLRFEFGDVPRDNVQLLRIYFDRGDLCSGPFDVDELMLHGGPPRPARQAAAAPKPPPEKQPSAPPEKAGEAPPE